MLELGIGLGVMDYGLFIRSHGLGVAGYGIRVMGHRLGDSELGFMG